MKMELEESYGHKQDAVSNEVGVKPSMSSEHVFDTDFEYRCITCTKPFASNYLLGFSDGASFSCC